MILNASLCYKDVHKYDNDGGGFYIHRIILFLNLEMINVENTARILKTHILKEILVKNY